MQAQITTYSNRKSYNDCCIYVLSVGDNSGKVLSAACPNCFVIQCANLTERILYKNLVDMLFIGKAFDPYLCGSVYNFLRISDFKKIIRENERLIIKSSFNQAAKKAEQLQLLKLRHLHNVAVIEDAKRALIRQFLINIKRV